MKAYLFLLGEFDQPSPLPFSLHPLPFLTEDL